MTRLATYLDRQGKPPAVPEALRLESADAVKLAKFFVALGFTAEKQTTAEGRQYILAKANGVHLSIVPSRTPTPADGFSMTLMVDDVAAAAARAAAAGGTGASPIKEIPGGKKCVVASPEGQRVVLAEKTGATKPAAIAAAQAPSPVVAAMPVAAAAPVKPAPGRTAAPLKVAAEPLDAIVVADEPEPARSEPPDFSFNAPARNKTSPRPALKPVRLRRQPDSVDDSDDADSEPSEYSPAERRTLAGVRIAGLLTAIGYGVMAVLSLLIIAETDIMWGDRRSYRGPSFVGDSIRLIGWFTLIAGKFFVVNKGIRRADASLVGIALFGDVAAMVCGVISRIGLFDFASSLIAAIATIVSSISFSLYLGRVGDAIRDRLIPTMARVVVLLYGVIVPFLAAVTAAPWLLESGQELVTTLIIVGYGGMRYCSLFGALGFVGLGTMMYVRVAPAKLNGAGAFGFAPSPRSRHAEAAADGDFEDDEDGTGLSIKGEALLRTIRTMCRISAAALLVALFAAILIRLGQGTSSQERQSSQLLSGLVSIAAVIVMLVAKGLCLGKKAEFGEPKLLKRSFVLDVVALGSAFCAGLIPFLMAPLIFLYLICMLFSPLVFAKYLVGIAEGIGDRPLAAAGERAATGWAVFGLSIFVMVVVAIAAAISGNVAVGFAVLLFTGIMSITALVTFILHTIMLVKFAILKLDGDDR